MLTTLRAVGATAAAALAALTLVGTAPSAVAAAPPGPVAITPAALPRGADPAVPYLRGGDVVDGDRRVDVPGRSAYLLGRAGRGYVVVSLVGRTWTTSRIGTGAPVTLLRGPLAEQVTLADDGRSVAVTRFGDRRTSVDVRGTLTGRRLGRGFFAGYPRVLDVQGDRAVVGGPDGGVLWNVRSGRRTVLDTARVYAADISSNLLASFDKDPYEGGCSSVSDLVSPRDLLWISCDLAVRSFSPDGDRMVVQDKLADGVGPNRLQVRTVEGRLLATYTVGSHVGDVSWEDDRTVLLDAYGQRRWAEVRCLRRQCERVSAVRRSPYGA
jgi:hypothetical protein